MKTSSASLKPLWNSIAALILLVVFALNSLQNSTHEDYRNSNFAKFWIAGHMVLTGLNPYNPAQWFAEHMRLGATSVPDKIFLYPLPQAFFLAPIALLPPQTAFFVWSILSQALLALTCFTLLKERHSAAAERLFVPLVISLLFFGPVYLTLQVGSIGVVAMVVILAVILLLTTNRSLMAGLLLSVLILKPPQGLPILFFAGIWLLLKRDWRALAGCIGGALVLLLSGLLFDPRWLSEFLSNSLAVSNRSLGMQSNVWSIAYISCTGNVSCTLAFGGILFTAVLAVGSYLIWRYQTRLSPLEIFNMIIPLGFVAAVYLFAYDQILYVFPIVWIAATVLEKTKSYLPVFLLLILLDVVSLAALFEQARTHRDLLSIVTTLLVLGLYLWLLLRQLRTSTPNRASA